VLTTIYGVSTRTKHKISKNKRSEIGSRYYLATDGMRVGESPLIRAKKCKKNLMLRYARKRFIEAQITKRTSNS